MSGFGFTGHFAGTTAKDTYVGLVGGTTHLGRSKGPAL